MIKVEIFYSIFIPGLLLQRFFLNLAHICAIWFDKNPENFSQNKQTDLEKNQDLWKALRSQIAIYLTYQCHKIQSDHMLLLKDHPQGMKSFEKIAP